MEKKLKKGIIKLFQYVENGILKTRAETEYVDMDEREIIEMDIKDDLIANERRVWGNK